MSFIEKLLAPTRGAATSETKSQNIAEWVESEMTLAEGGARPAERLFGIPAVLSAMRLIGETAAMLPIHVYRDVEYGHERVGDAWQSDLLRRRPAPDYTPFDWRSDAYSMLLGYGNFVARKIRTGSGSRRRIRYLVPMDPRRTIAERDGFGTVYTYTNEDGRTETLTRRDVFHVRGFTFHGEPWGLAPITVCRLALSSGVSLEEYFARFLRNNARPGGILEFPNTVAKDEAERILETWAETYGGPGNAGKTGILGGGASWKTVGMSMQDAQFIEHHNFSVEQVARIFNLPAKMLAMGQGGGPGAGTASAPPDIGYFSTMSLGPWLARFDGALNADADIMPDGSGMFVEHLADALLKPHTKDRYEAYKAARQGGWITANEIRRKENMPPVEGGDEIQQTPVGGAVNPSSGDEPAPDDPDAGNDDPEAETE